MTKTKNCQLNQWDAADPIRREDFNADNAAIDAAIAAAGALPYATGSYTGNGETQTIELGFQPRFVIITGQEVGSSSSAALIGFIAFSGGVQIGSVLTFTESGFSVVYTAQTCPMVNAKNRIFSYLAFR